MAFSNIIGINCYDGLYYNFILTGLTGSDVFSTGTTYNIDGVLDDGRTINTCIEIYDTYTGTEYTGVTIQDTLVLEDPISFFEYQGINECVQCTSETGPEDLPTNVSPPSALPIVPVETYRCVLTSCSGGNFTFYINKSYYESISGNTVDYFYTGDTNCYEFLHPYNVDTSILYGEETPYISLNELNVGTCCVPNPTTTPTPVVPEEEASDCYLYELTNNGNSDGNISYIPCGSTLTGVTLSPSETIYLCSDNTPIFINEGFSEFGIVNYDFSASSGVLSPVISYNTTEGSIPQNVDISLAAGQITFNQPEGETDTTFGPVTFRVEGSAFCSTVVGGCGSVDFYLYKSGDTSPTQIFTVNLVGDDTVTFVSGVTLNEVEYGDYHMLYVSPNNAVVYEYIKFIVEQSETFVDIESTNVGSCSANEFCDFTVSVTGSSSCSNTGIATVTETTGVGPFSFTWSNGQTGTTVSDLPSGNITVTMVDSGGECQDVTQTVTIPTVPALSVKSVTSTRANCFECDGTLTIEILGGTAPYYYSGSTGESSETFINDTTYTFTGLCKGNFYITVTDSGGCVLNRTEYIPSTSQITLQSIVTNESLCNDSGEIVITTSNYTGLKTYTLSAGTELVDSVLTTNQTQTFDNLESGTYNVGIYVEGTDCSYTQEVTISNSEKFIINETFTGSTCGLNNALIGVELLSGSTSLTYPFTVILTKTIGGELVYQNLVSTDQFQIDNLYSDNYTLSITDNNSCTINKNIIVTGTTPIDISVYVYECDENGGNAEVVINDIESPYTITWKDSENNVILTGDTIISGLTNGVYNVYVEDNNGCVEIERVTISCESENIVNGDIIYTTLCEQTFITETNSQYTFEMMLADAIDDYTSNNGLPDGSYNATFTAILEINGPNVPTPIVIEIPFHSSSSIYSSPTVEQWISAVENLISQVDGLESYEVTDETYLMIGECNNEMLNGALVQLTLDIDITMNEFDIDGGDFNNIEGIFEIEFDLGTYTGPVTMTFNAKNVPDRLIMEYNNQVVADSLFVGDYLNTNQYFVYAALITAESQRTVYTWDSENSNFVSTGQQITTNYGPEDIASTTDTRLNGSAGNQIGVVAGYPSDTSSSADGNIQLSFVKTTQQPTTMKTTIIGSSSTEWTLNFDI